MAARHTEGEGSIRAYLLDPRHFKNVLFVILGGYAAPFFLWEASHRAELESYILTNQLPVGSRPSLLVLGLGMATAVALWLAAGWARGRRGGDVSVWLDRTSGAALALALLPFLPVLGITGIASERPWMTMGLIALMAAIAALAAYTAGSSSALWGQPGGSAALLPVSEVGGVDPGLLAISILALAYAAYMSALTITRHNALMTHSFDLGIYDQALYTLLHTGVMRSTQHGAEAIIHLGNHFSPIFYLVAPIYGLYQDARMLLILQSIALGIGAIPVYLIARRLTGSRWLALALGAGYLLYPALHGANTFDFHQIVLATPLLLFSFYFLESGRDRAFLVALLLAMLVKEEVALTVAAIGAYVFVGRGRFRMGALLMIVGASYFVVVTQLVMPALGGAPQVNRFAAMMPPGEEGLSGVAKTLLTNPFYALSLVFSEPERLIYLAQIFLPLLFLPLLGGAAWLAALPAIAVSLFTDAETQFSISYHYSAIFIPFAFYLAALGARAFLSLRRASPEIRPIFSATGLAGGLLVAGLAMNYSYGWVFSKQFYEMSLNTQHAAAVRHCIADIPPQASVSAMSDLVPHLSARRNIYLFPIVNDAEYIAFDADPAANFWPFTERDGRMDAIRALMPHIISGEYGLAQAQDGCLVLRRGADPARNGEAVRVLMSARYEAESLPSDFPDSVAEDGAASEGRARRAESETPHPVEKNALTYGPYDALFPGRYRVDYLLRHEGPADDGPAASLDVFSNAAGGTLASEDVLPAAISADGYTAASVDLDIRQAWNDLEYRVLFRGPGTVWADQVRIEPIAVDAPAAGFEAETVSGAATFSIADDETASDGKARVADTNAPSGVLAEAQVGALLPGAYRAVYTLKAGEVGTAPFAILEVVDGGNVLASRELGPGELAAGSGYQPLVLDFWTDRQLADVALRVQYEGGARLHADRLDLIYRLEAP